MSQDTSAATHLGLFAKQPVPGRVKTRLAATVGEEAAARFHALSLQLLIERFAETADCRTIGHASLTNDGDEYFQQLAGEAWQLWAQPAGDLGERMQAFFAHAFANGAGRVLLIGSDSPTLPESMLQNAIATLACTDVVIVPAHDGGYCLIGLRSPQPYLFEDIAWSTDAVLAQTRERAQQAGLSCKLLPVWTDVDTADDLPGLLPQLESWSHAASEQFATALRSYVQSLMQRPSA